MMHIAQPHSSPPPQKKKTEKPCERGWHIGMKEHKNKKKIVKIISLDVLQPN